MDSDGVPSVPAVNLSVKDMLSPFTPLKNTQARVKRPSLPPKKRPACSPTSGTQATTELLLPARDDATSHGFSGLDEAAKPPPAASAEVGPSCQTLSPSRKRQKQAAAKPVSGYCEFCELSFEDMNAVCAPFSACHFSFVCTL